MVLTTGKHDGNLLGSASLSLLLILIAGPRLILLLLLL
jgi:hypothetical protein